jgi:hypothetical protein
MSIKSRVDLEPGDIAYFLYVNTPWPERVTPTTVLRVTKTTIVTDVGTFARKSGDLIGTGKSRILQRLIVNPRGRS